MERSIPVNSLPDDRVSDPTLESDPIAAIDAVDGPVHELASRIGKAVEYMVAAMVVLGTRGEVNASTAIVDDAGVDLTFFNRSGSIDLQVKARTLDAKTSQASKLVANVRWATFKPRDDLVFLFVIADLDQMLLGPFWLVPSSAFAERANVLRQGQVLRITASMHSQSHDKWAEFRVERSVLPARIRQLVEADPARQLARTRGRSQLVL